MSEIQDDELIRRTNVYDIDGRFTAIRKDLVITKEEFLACYNEWVIKPMRENSVPEQFGFYVPKCWRVDPIDNDGRTPV